MNSNERLHAPKILRMNKLQSSIQSGMNNHMMSSLREVSSAENILKSSKKTKPLDLAFLTPFSYECDEELSYNKNNIMMSLGGQANRRKTVTPTPR